MSSLIFRSRICNVFRSVLKPTCIVKRTYANESSTIALESKKGTLTSTILKGTGVGIIIGAVYVGYSFRKALPMDPTSNPESIRKLSELPNVQFARQIQIPADKSGLDIVLFQYPTCPFCCKVRAFLDYYGISYKVVEVNPVLRQQIKWSEYKKVPILLVGTGKEYMQLNDSSMIISCLATFITSKNKITLEQASDYYPVTFDDQAGKNQTIMNKYFVMDGKVDTVLLKIDKDEREWRRWADEVLVHTLSPNVYRTKEEALQAFNWFSEVGEWNRLFSAWERTLVVYLGAYAMYYIGKKLKKKHHLKNNVRQSLYDECTRWVKEVNSRGKFFGGKTPNLADLAIYGVLSSIEGCQAFQDLLQETKIGKWYNDMKSAVSSHEGLKAL